MKHVHSAILALLFTLLCALPASATSIVELSFEELVEQSQLIFQGRVLRTQHSDIDGLSYTTVWFANEDLIKGKADDELSLRFLGGALLAGSIEVAGQYIPRPGDHAIYFVQNADSNLVNPLTGWQQGAFLIETGPDGEAVLNLTERPDLILFNTRADPLVQKMLSMNFSAASISAKFPEYLHFPVQDFTDAVRSLMAENP